LCSCTSRSSHGLGDSDLSRRALRIKWPGNSVYVFNAKACCDDPRDRLAVGFFGSPFVRVCLLVPITKLFALETIENVNIHSLSLCVPAGRRKSLRRARGVCVYYCRTYYKAVRVGGGGEWRTCAMRYDEPRLGWTRLTTTH
jgi:hypothetical protein